MLSKSLWHNSCSSFSNAVNDEFNKLWYNKYCGNNVNDIISLGFKSIDKLTNKYEFFETGNQFIEINNVLFFINTVIDYLNIWNFFQNKNNNVQEIKLTIQVIFVNEQ